MKEVSGFANRLKEQRKKLGYTQTQIAEICGVSGRMWGDYERGKYFPRNENLIAIEKAGIDVQYVMYGEQRSDFRQPEKQAETKLTADEQDLLAYYRQASDNGKFVILSVAQGAEKKANQDNQIQRHYGT